MNEWGLVNEDKVSVFVMELRALDEKYSLRIYPGYIYLEDDDGNSIIIDDIDLD